MNIDWNAFTPYASLAGGALIGLAAAMFVLLNGRIAGISGILGGLLKPVRGDVSWRVAFVLGLVASPLLYALIAKVPPLAKISSSENLVPHVSSRPDSYTARVGVSGGVALMRGLRIRSARRS